MRGVNLPSSLNPIDPSGNKGSSEALLLSEEHFRPMDLSKAKAVEDGSNNDETTTTTQSGEVTRFEANESADGYAAFGDSASIAKTISKTVLDNGEFYKTFDLEWGQDLEDYPDMVEEVDDPSPQEKLALVHHLAKGSFGDRQSNLNSGYGMGWDSSKTPPKVYENKNKVHYLRVNNDLPTFDTETLSGEEVAELENEGLDMENHGFDQSVIGPYLPKINGERVPILVEDGDEVMKALEMLDSINWDELTYCEENGDLQGTPSLGPSESDSDKGEKSDLMDGVEMDSEDDEVFNLAENPERVNEVNVTDLRGQGPEEFNVSNIDNRRTIQLLVRYESEGNTRKGAMERLKQRRSALKGDDDNDEEPSPEATSNDNEVVADGGVSPEKIQKIFGFSDLEMDGVKRRAKTGQADSLKEAAKQVADL